MHNFDISTHLVFDMSGVATLCVNTRSLYPGVLVSGCSVLPRIDIGIDNSVKALSFNTLVLGLIN